MDVDFFIFRSDGGIKLVKFAIGHLIILYGTHLHDFIRYTSTYQPAYLQFCCFLRKILNHVSGEVFQNIF